MGLPELKELWSAGGSWHETLDDWTESREAALPRLHDIVARLLDGESSAGDFKSAMDSFSKQTKYGGFHGTSGQMFLNTLVNAGADDEVVIALRAALTAPKDEQDCRGKFTEFLAFVDEARERARDSGVAVPSARLHAVLPELLLGGGGPGRLADLLPELARQRSRLTVSSPRPGRLPTATSAFANRSSELRAGARNRYVGRRIASLAPASSTGQPEAAGAPDGDRTCRSPTTSTRATEVRPDLSG